jgi:hypothetical protein
MLGFDDGWIFAAYLLCILSAVVCVVYGLVNWNKGGDDEALQVEEEKKWEETERKIEDNM